MSSFSLKSHSDKYLFQHLKKVGNLSRRIVHSKIIENKEIFVDISYIVGISHDFAKSTKYFQETFSSEESTKYAYHGFLSSLFGYHLTKKYLTRKKLLDSFPFLPTIAWLIIKRHHGNLLDFGKEIQKLDEYEARETIEKQVKNIKKYSLDEVRKIYKKLFSDVCLRIQDISDFLNKLADKRKIKKFEGEIYRTRELLWDSENNDLYFFTLFLYSILLDADKLDASGLETIPQRFNNIDSSLVDKYKKAKFGTPEISINKLREEAYNDVLSSLNDVGFSNIDDRIVSINLPTGLGKTLTGFSFALKLKQIIRDNYGFKPRIIYSLPFISIIDQNSLVLSEVLAKECSLKWKKLFNMEEGKKEEKLRRKIPSNLFLKHHHLADVKYQEQKGEQEETKYNIRKSLLLTEGWHSEIVITTFVQFFHSLITNRNRAARKFHNITNSIIILDEVQAIPFKYWRLTKKVLRYLTEKFNCWIIFMTATRPYIFKKGELVELADKREKYFNSLDRVEYDFDINKKPFEEFKQEFFKKTIETEEKDLMLILNTINSCKEMYDYLKEKLSEHRSSYTIDKYGICQFPTLELINLSTHILPDSRLQRIEHIKEETNNDKRKIIITTQLVEAGVDISVDTIYRDFAPLDSIVQAAGRCNREGEGTGKVKLRRLYDDQGNQYFSSYIYDPELLDTTENVVGQMGEKVSESKFNKQAVKQYFQEASCKTIEDKDLIEALEKLKFSKLSQFNLIEKDYPTISIFIEINQEAKNIRKQIEEILEQEQGFKKRNELLKLKKAINRYTLSIRCKEELLDKIATLPSLFGNEEKRAFRYVPQRDLKDWYNKETGFSPPETTITMRMI